VERGERKEKDVRFGYVGLLDLLLVSSTACMRLDGVEGGRRKRMIQGGGGEGGGGGGGEGWLSSCFSLLHFSSLPDRRPSVVRGEALKEKGTSKEKGRW